MSFRSASLMSSIDCSMVSERFRSSAERENENINTKTIQKQY
jgi:hypothetical protein